MSSVVRNVIKVVDGGMDALYPFIKTSGDGQNVFLDLEAIIPMPWDLKVEVSSRGEDAYSALYTDYKQLMNGFNSRYYLEMKTRKDLIAYMNETNPRGVELARQYRANEERYGYRSWYDWTFYEWCTRRNSYGGTLDGNVIHFLTDCRCPVPVYERLAVLLPDHVMYVGAIDEFDGTGVRAIMECGYLSIEHTDSGEYKDEYALVNSL